MRGLPVFSASRVAKLSASRSIASASLRSRVERSTGLVRDQVLKASAAAVTAASICAAEASGRSVMTSSVFGLTIAWGASAPATKSAPISILVSSMVSSP